jgi:L-alanine-DL-glutamate epimerase-like enolase superfamily enzyme
LFALCCQYCRDSSPGGISELRNMLVLAEDANGTVAPHSSYFGLGLLATLHVLAAVVQEMLVERLYVELEASLFGKFTDAREGIMTVPDGPGLGCEPDAAVIARYRVR